MMCSWDILNPNPKTQHSKEVQTSADAREQKNLVEEETSIVENS
jgi:hypothetical protein